MITRHGDRYSSLRVKTSSTRSFQWSGKGQWEPLRRYDSNDRTDFVVLVAFNGNGPRCADTYVVPARVVLDTINEVYRDYHSFPKRDGTPRKWSTQRVLRLDGQARPDNTSYDFARKWAEYHEAWHLLEDGAGG